MAVFAAAALGLGLFVYLFIVTVDPWGVLPLSPPLPRVPISTNARFAFPALARAKAFDSALIGTSTMRLLRPAALDAALGTRFVNLAMNAATPYEQSRMLDLFVRHHPAADTVIIGMESPWCAPVLARLTPREFPAWMYDPGATWRGYLNVFDLYAVQEAGAQFAVMLHLKRPPYGRDGYTRFLPDDRTYDAARAQVHLDAEPLPTAAANPAQVAQRNYPGLEMLTRMLAELPPPTRALVMFVPYYISLQGDPGSEYAAEITACKQQAAILAGTRPNTWFADFMRPSPITEDPTNYWDPRHYRTGIADRLVHDIAAILHSQPAIPGDAAVTAPKSPFVR